MNIQFIDRYNSTLASSYTSGGSSLSVSSASLLPSDGDCDFYLIVQAEGSNTEEVFHVTSKSGTTLTVAGAQANTSASNHASGATVIGSIMTATAYQELALIKIAATSTTGSATSVDFQSIPATFMNLVITFNIRTTAAVSTIPARMKINNDGTAANYTSARYILSTGGSVSTGDGASSTAGAFIDNCPGTSATASDTAHGCIRINDYKGTTFNKRYDIQAGYAQSGDDIALIILSGIWKSTAAISRLTFTLDSSDAFVNGSTFTVYGEM